MNAAATAAGVTVRPVRPVDAAATVTLLDRLRVSLFGIHTPRLHHALVADGVAHRIDCRVAVDANDLRGVVLAAPRAYWKSALLQHPLLAVECLRARLIKPASAAESTKFVEPAAVTFDAGDPRRTWTDPGDAWRIIFVGTAPSARGRGVVADLYKAVMRDRSLVARIATDNHASLRLHRSVGWRLYPDGDVVLAVHERVTTT